MLEMAGVTSIFDLYPTREKAISACRKPVDSLSVLSKLERPTRTENGVRYTIESGSSGHSALRVVGSLEDVLHARLTGVEIRSLRFSDLDYSLGLGALGESVADALPPPGGDDQPALIDGLAAVRRERHAGLLQPVKDTGDVRVFSGFNVVLDGPFHEIIDVETGDEEGISLSDLHRSIFAFAAERGVQPLGCYRGRHVGGGCRRPQLRCEARTPPYGCTSRRRIHHGRSIRGRPDRRRCGTEVPGRHDGEFRHRRRPASRALVVCGEGRRAQIHLHNHAVIFRRIPWDGSLDLGRQIQRIVSEGEFVDMRHLLDGTRIRRAKLGISYVSEIIRE